jgi:aconitase A
VRSDGFEHLLTSFAQGKQNSVISSYNRNFVGRHDGNPGTHSFVTSPELVAAFTFSGSLQFNPATETIATPDGKAFAFSPPHAEELPSHFEDGTALYQAPPENGEDVEVHVAPDSDVLQLLAPFEPWHEGRASDLSILIKVKGKQHHLPTPPPLPTKHTDTPAHRQMHNRPHLPRRPLVQIPRPPREHL